MMTSIIFISLMRDKSWCYKITKIQMLFSIAYYHFFFHSVVLLENIIHSSYLQCQVYVFYISDLYYVIIHTYIHKYTCRYSYACELIIDCKHASRIRSSMHYAWLNKTSNVPRQSKQCTCILILSYSFIIFFLIMQNLTLTARAKRASSCMHF